MVELYVRRNDDPRAKWHVVADRVLVPAFDEEMVTTNCGQKWMFGLTVSQQVSGADLCRRCFPEATERES